LPATDPCGIVEKGEPVSRINAEMYCILRRDSGRRFERKSKTFDIQWPSRMGIGVGVLERKCDKGGAYCINCKASRGASLGIDHSRDVCASPASLVSVHRLPLLAYSPPLLSPSDPRFPFTLSLDRHFARNSQDSPLFGSTHQARIAQNQWPTHRLAPLTALTSQT